MAATHKKLSSGSFATSTGAIASPGSGKTWLVKTIMLHNTSATAYWVEVYYSGTATANRIIRVSLAGDETFEYAVGHLLPLDEGASPTQTLQGKAENAAVNYHIFGAEE